ncbi:MAG: helix-turn-helix domain-containing protein [Patescibacteria group bacterium]
MIQQILSSLDLKEEEIQTYLVLLETGPITVGDLAKKLVVPRPSLYGFLERLQDKGLVVESQLSHVKQFIAERPEKIELLFEQKIAELEKQKAAYKQIMPSLEQTMASAWLSPKFQLYESEDGLRHLLKDMLLYRDIETEALWPIKAMIDILSPAFFEYLNERRIKSNLYTRAIWPKDQVVAIEDHPYLGVGLEFKREIRIAPENLDFSMGYWMYGNKTAFISSRKESFGFIVESKEMRQLLKTQFEMIWQISTPVKVNFGKTKGFLEEAGILEKER